VTRVLTREGKGTDPEETGMTTTTPTTPTTTTMSDDTVRLLAGQFITFLETGVAADGLFAPDLFTDFTMPLWRLQADTAEGGIALRAAGHPMVGRVPRHRLDVTGAGFVLEVEETWHADGELPRGPLTCRRSSFLVDDLRERVGDAARDERR
jgi:hypothetical protein